MKAKTEKSGLKGKGMTRKSFLELGLAAAALTVIPAPLLAANDQWIAGETRGRRSYRKKRKKMIYGWTTCLTYETNDRNLGYEYFSNLLDEMHSHGMTRLVVLMGSHGYYSPMNHGLAWPVKNEKLRPQIDKKTLNAFEETEFFSRIIDKAHALNIKVYVELKYLGLIGVKKGYPGIDFKRKKDGSLANAVVREVSDYEREAIETLNICCDNDQSNEYIRDQIRDVLTRYIHLDGIVLEHPSYSPCYCPSTQQRVKNDTGKEIDELTEEQYQQWKAIRVRDILTDFKNLIRSINPAVEFGFYTGFSPRDGNIQRFQLNRGHNPQTLKQVGLDFVMPYCEGRHEDKEIEEMQKVIDYLDPFDIYLHTVIRKESPHNYQLPPKGPEYIRSIIAWGKEYHKKNPRFMGMTFFNEVKIPDENRQAVYDSIREKIT